MARRAVRTLAWTGSLVGLLVVLRAAAHGDLATPPLRSIDDLGAWADDRGAAASAVGLVRLAAELAVWYLLGLTALHGLVAARRPHGAPRWVDHLAPAVVGRTVRAGLGVGLLATTALPVGGTALAGEPPGAAVMQPVPDHRSGTTARMVPRPVPAGEPAASPVPAQHRVEPGESFWTIAADVLEQRWGRPPSDAEIDPYWRALLDANRARLVTGDPDHILPGQVFEVPPPPPPR